MLEAAGGDDLQYPARFVAGVPKRVPLIAGFEDEVSFVRVDDLVAELRPHTSLKDVAVLVLVGVAVQRRYECPRGIGCSTREKPPLDSSLQTMNRTPKDPKSTVLPSPGPRTRGGCRSKMILLCHRGRRGVLDQSVV